MRITFTVKPIKIEGRTKGDVMTKLRNRFSTLQHVMGTKGNHLRTSGDNRIVYTLQKFNRKTKQTRNRHNKYHDSVVVREAHWVMHAYVFHPEFPVHLSQEGRTFKMVVDSQVASPYGVNQEPKAKK